MALQKNNHPLEFSDLKHHAIAFPLIEPEMFLPRLKEAITKAKEQIREISECPESPNFENTILALEMSGEDVALSSSIFFNQLNALTNEKMQALAGEIGPILSNYSSDVLLDPALFKRIKTVFDNRQSLANKPGFGTEETELLEKVYTDFTRNGALLNEEQKSELRKIDAELSQLSPKFSENVLKATNDFQLVIKDEKELAGLPPSSIEAARIAAEEKGHKSAWLFTLHAPSYVPFMNYGAHRPTREKLYKAYNSRAFNDKYDNQKNIIRILELKLKRSKLLGFKNHADFVLEKRMAESPEKVFAFLEKIKAASIRAAKTDVQKILEYAKANGGPEQLMPWDFIFWSERLKENLFKLNAEELRPYFQLENVVAGMFEHARRLYGLLFRESKEYPVYHDDVKVYEVSDEKSGEFMGLFYTDYFPRESKNGGAWMTNYYEQGFFKGKVHRPHVAIVCNFTKPTPGKPALLTFEEVQTIFHEFGHSLHSLLSKCKYRSISGTNVYWDFVELPSQIMENWILEKESLDLFAKHYETGEKIPAEFTKKIKDSSMYLAGYSSIRQVTFAYLDMSWHTSDIQKIQSVDEFEDSVIGSMRVLPKVSGINFSCAFSHIFAGGYSAGYYSYKWAEVLDADAFEVFKERGLFDVETAKKFKENILSRGGTEHPMQLYKKFRGREPDPDALLRRDGLI